MPAGIGHVGKLGHQPQGTIGAGDIAQSSG